MTSKVQINILEGTILVEGETKFVKEVYSDFKDVIIEMMNVKTQSKHDNNPLPKESRALNSTTKRRANSKKVSSFGIPPNGINPDNPSLDKNLDTTGINEYYSQFSPKNHSEKILIFMRFLKEKSDIKSPTTDHIYTCYNAVNEKPAAAFAQAFRDTSSKKFGYINYNAANDISLTFIGNRHFDHDLKKKEVE